MQDLPRTILVLSIVSIVLCVSFTALRIGIRLHHKNLGIDDWSALVGLVFWLTCLGLTAHSGLEGLGARGPYTERQMYEVHQDFSIFQDVYIWANIPVKVSICLSIHRVLKHYTWVSWTLYVMIFAIASSSIITSIYLLTFCTPAAFRWDRTIPGGTCKPQAQMLALSLAWSYINIITDWVVALLPVSVLWRVNMPWRQKVTVACVLGLGIFASTATIVRMMYLPYFEATDTYLYGLGMITLWTIIELTVAIMAVSLIALRPLLRLFGMSTTTDKRPGGAVAGVHLNIHEPDDRFFQMHGWSMQFGLDTYIGGNVSSPTSNAMTEGSNAKSSLADPDLSQPPQPIPG